MKADENLLHFIKSHPEAVVDKGFGLFVEFKDEITIESGNKKMYSLEVPSQNGVESYAVTIQLVAGTVEDDCECKAFENTAIVSMGWQQHSFY